MKLENILYTIKVLQAKGELDLDVEGIEFDSRKVTQGVVFVAVKGASVDGHDFIQKAIDQNAAAIVCEQIPKVDAKNVVFIQVADSAEALGVMASNFYYNPSSKLKLVGVTGTNGKTTIATLLYRLVMRLGYKAGLISTIKYYVGENEYKSTHTTPDQLRLNELMAEMVEAGCDYCFMEVSSHAIDQKRIAGLDFDGGIFTNITHDHLDYHKTFSAYITAKKAFFDGLKPDAFAITNADDKNGSVMLQNTKAGRFSYSIRAMADFRAKIIESHFDGTMLNIDGNEVWTHFVGKFNAYNLLSLYGSALLLGFSKDEVLVAMSTLKPADGRFEIIRSTDGRFVVVDYAHTPDALKNVLVAIDGVRTKNEQVICVVGAGGDRDKTKRPEMAAIACEYSDKVILTSDNPRTEDPEQILIEMGAGVDVVGKRKTLTITDRRQAIKTAVMLAQPGDIVLLAGKGHEDYQEVNGVRHHFDDREEVKMAFGLTD